MEYEGKLYGKVGKRYIPLKMTADDVDKLKGVLKAKDQEIMRILECLRRLSRTAFRRMAADDPTAEERIDFFQAYQSADELLEEYPPNKYDDEQG